MGANAEPVMAELPSRWWWDLSTAQFAALDMAEVIAVLPIAATEQHGPHLPVRVDAAINAGIIARAVALMPDDLPALILPMLPIGKSDEHDAFPGTLSLSYETLGRVWFDIGASIRRAGCRKLVLFNSHGGQIHLMQIVCRELRVKLEMFAVGCSWFSLIDDADLFSAGERRHGIHGGEAETSLLLHLHPELVALERAQNFVPSSVAMESSYRFLTPEGAVSFGWQIQDLQRHGACGNAASADAGRGGVIVERAARALIELLREVQRFPLSSLTSATAYRNP